MKIRYLAVGFTLVITLIFCFFVSGMNKERQSAVDMVSYNGELKQIGKAIRSGMTREEVEAQYDCGLLFLEDLDYRERLGEAMAEGAVIFDYETDEGIMGKVIWNRESRNYELWKKQMMQRVFFTLLGLLTAGYMLLAVIYVFYLRPFQKLKSFSAEIARGNLDFPLPMERHNFFGAFTESFDLMREELKRAKEKEYQANRSKRELTAELSHDIRTPVSAIKAACEVLEVKETSEDVKKKIKVIATKADTIDRLVSNLLHAALEELEELKTEIREESSLLIPEMFESMKSYSDLFAGVEIVQENQIPQCLLYLDSLRMEQIVDNLVSNACKYAKTPVFVRYQDGKEGITIFIRDKGKGVPEEELCLVTEKFFRGSNTQGISGSGLGLYLAKYFMEQMQGGMECYNDGGFCVTLFVRKVAKA